MKCIVLFSILAVAAAVDYYNVKDDLDIDPVINDPKQLEAFIDCFLDKGPCTELTSSYKVNIQESFEQACARCTDNLKYLYWRFLNALKEIFPNRVDEYLDHYDPERKYYDALIKEVSKFTKPTKK